MTKSVLITGANGGIGQALCQIFKDAGYFVIATDVVIGSCICDAFIEADLEVFCADLQYREAFFSNVREYLQSKGLFALINNAAIQILGKTEKIEIEDWQKTLNINLTAPFY